MLSSGSQGWQTYIENNRDGNSLRPGNKDDRITYKRKSPGRVGIAFSLNGEVCPDYMYMCNVQRRYLLMALNLLQSTLSKLSWLYYVTLNKIPIFMLLVFANILIAFQKLYLQAILMYFCNLISCDSLVSIKCTKKVCLDFRIFNSNLEFYN